MGISVYDPTRRTQSRLPRALTRRDEEEEKSLGLISPQARAARSSRISRPQEMAIGANVATTRSEPKDDRPWWEKGIGVAVNNPVVRNILQPLDILAVPQRAIASATNEIIDYAQGEGFSGRDLYNQINPLYAFHRENAEDSIGMGDVLQNALPGGTGNEWADRAIGFLGDVGTDPLIAGTGASKALRGLGAVDKGLDAGRQGTRLGAVLAEGGDLTRAQRLARSAEWQAKNKSGSQGALGGRQVRNNRIGEATGLVTDIDNQGTKAWESLANLYESPLAADEFRAATIETLRSRAGRGLTVRGADSAVDDLVDTILNVEPPRITTPGNVAGAARQWFNNTSPGRTLARMDAPIDVENAAMVFNRGNRFDSLEDVEDFMKAGQAYRIDTARQGPGGTAGVLGQMTVRQRRKAIRDEAKRYGDGYIGLAQREGGTELNQVFNWVRDNLAPAFGVTIPDLGDNYVPLVLSQQMKRKLSSNFRFADDWRQRFGLEAVDLQGESGRLLKRGEEFLAPGMRIPLQLEDGRRVVLETGDGSIDAINASGRKIGLGKVLEDDPMNLVDQYVQSISEDIGRRAARAEEIALGRGVEYNPRANIADPARSGEQAREQQAAVQRLQGRGVNTAQVNTADAAARKLADTRAEVEYLSNLSEAELARIGRNLDDVDTVVQLLDDMEQRISQMDYRGSGQAVLMDAEVQGMLKNLKKEIKEPGALRAAYDYANRYFKTFAVLTPGFHLRNWMSAAFMNAADGVPFRTTYRGMREWSKFTDHIKSNPDNMNAGLDYLAKLDEPTRQAFEAVFASGAGGRFVESGVGEGRGQRLLDKPLENRFTRFSQDVGASVEGSIRLGMALDSIEKGASVADAAARITRVQFNYAQTSRFDDRAKAIAPFWSFFSRNIPLQIMQMWARPGAYLTYERFRDNFMDPTATEGLDGEIPDYIEAGRGVPSNLGPFNWLEPDLPHTRVTEDIERVADIGRDPLGMLSNVTPVVSAPMEYAFGKNSFTGQEYDETDLTPFNPYNLAHYAALLPAAASGGLKFGGSGRPVFEDRLLNAITSIDPNLSRAERLLTPAASTFNLPGVPEGVEGNDRAWEAWARTFGLPVRTITQDQVDGAGFGSRIDAQRQAMVRRLLESM